MPDRDENIAKAADEAQPFVILAIFRGGGRLACNGRAAGFERAQPIRLLARENAQSDGAVEAFRGDLQGMLSSTMLRLV